MASGYTIKVPPRMDGGDNYETWKNDLEMWSQLTDLEPEKQAFAVHGVLDGAARIASGELGKAVLGKKDGLDKLIEKLDQLFLKDKSTRQYATFRQCYNVRREISQSVESFITKFEQILFKMNKLDMKLPDAVEAFMLLEASNLPESDSKLVLSGVREVSLESMKECMVRILGGQFKGGTQQPVAVKEEPVFECNQTLYSKNSKYRDSRPGRGAGRGYINRGGNRRDNKVNPLDRSGRPSKCAICGSIYHWARNCSRKQESFNVQGRSEEEDVHFSLFVGYNEARKNNKSNSLMEQCQGCALMDSGCTKTVAGEKWFKNYQDSLSEYDKEKIREQQSNSVFTFGDGRMVDSTKKVVIPCYINNKRSTIETDIVKCDIPLLMSHKSMKRGKMIIDFGSDTLTIGKANIDLKKTESGHYLLPLSP